MPDQFTAVTWNVLHTTTVDELAPVLARTQSQGASLWLLQEASQSSIRRMFRDAGLASYRYAPQYLLAWDPDVWMPRRTWGERLAATPFHRQGGHTAYVDAAMGILCDEAGRTLTAMSYHTPSSVQQAHKPPYREQALQQAARTWGELARDAKTHAVLFGGDDNVDEGGHWGPWAFMLGKATGLRQVQAPSGTHGKRRIDDFRIKGLRPGEGWVQTTPGDHRAHVRSFTWT